MTEVPQAYSDAVGGKGFIPDYDTAVFDMKQARLEYGDKVFYNARKGYVEACFFLALSDDPKDLEKSHRCTCYVLCMEASRPYITKVSSYYLVKADWDNKLSPSDTLTTGHFLLNYIDQNKR